MESVLTFTFEKATKNYWRYTQLGGINKLYLTPSDQEKTGTVPPPTIQTVIEVSSISVLK